MGEKLSKTRFEGLLSYATFCYAGKLNWRLDFKYKTKIALYKLGLLKILSLLIHFDCSEQTFEELQTNNAKKLTIKSGVFLTKQVNVR